MYVLKMWQIVVLLFIICLIFLIYKKKIINFKKIYFIENNLSNEDELDKIQEFAKQSIEDAVEFAQNSPNPKIESLLEDVYAD